MSNDLARAGQRRTALPGIVLAVMTLAFLLVSVARAEDPPIVAVGPVTASGNTASGDVGSDAKTNACVNDDRSHADPSASDGDPVKLNQGSCQEAAGSSAGSGGSQGGSGPQAGSGSQKSGSRGGSGSTRSNASATTGVAAGNAAGLRIARVRPVTDGVSKTKSFRVLVTLKDMQGRLVRDAIVTISKAPGARNTVSGMCSAFSNRLGQATIVVHVPNESLGKRLFLKISARTPKARSIALRSVRLPALG
jgi:hypothetical protein